MEKVFEIEYFISVASPWTYLGSIRFTNIVKRYGINPVVRPVDLGAVFAATGGTVFHKRSPQRQHYRQVELARWATWLKVPLNLEPLFYPVDREPASRLVIAARELGENALVLSNAILAAIWAQDLNIADWDVLAEITRWAGFDTEMLVSYAQNDLSAHLYERDTNAAIACGVFGVPSYIIDGEIFWGQDRLDFVERKLELATTRLQ